MKTKSLCACLAILVSLSAHATIFYCNTTDEIHNALTNVKAGDEIVIHPGTYISKTSINDAYFYAAANGSALRPIVIRSASSSNPAYLRGNSISSKTVLRIEGDYWIVKDLNISNGKKALVFDNSDYSKAIDCIIHSTGNEAVHVRDGSDYVSIEGCTIYNTGNDNPGFGEGIYIGTDRGSWDSYDPYCDYTLVTNCTLGPDIRAEAFDVKEGTKETTIEHNTINGQGISGINYADSFIDLKGTRTYVRYNVFKKNGESKITKGIAVIDRKVDLSSYEHAIHDNTFTMDDDQINVVEAYSGGSEVYAWNNTRNPSGELYGNNINESCPSWYDLCATDAQQPSVIISTPNNSSSFSEGDSIELTANVIDNDKPIAHIKFYSDSGFMGEDDSSPYKYVWKGAGAGEYRLRAVATDSDGVSTTSNITTITVNANTNDYNLAIIYKCGDKNPTNNKIKPNIKIVNQGSETISYENLKLRYWFTKEPSSALEFTCDYASLGSSHVNGAFVGVGGDAYYLEVSFDGAAGNLKGSDDSGSIKLRINEANWTDFDENDDYSFDPSITSYEQYAKVTLYHNDNLVWGTEPFSPITNLSFSDAHVISMANKDTFFKMYPNPTSDFLKIIPAKEWAGSKMEVFNMSGQAVKVDVFYSDAQGYTIDMSSLPMGYYFVNMNKAGRNISKKVLIR